MISRYAVSLHGQDMAEINENLLILDVNYTPASITDTTTGLANRDGALVTRRYKEVSTVTISFALRIYDIAVRQSVCQSVIQWAMKGGKLVINDRPDCFLNVICKTPPAISSARDWTAALTVVFEAYSIPYWQDEQITSYTLTGRNARGSIYVPGSAERTFANVIVKANESVSSLTVGVGDTYITLSGISIPAGRTVLFDYDSEQNLRIRQDSTSLLSKRTPASSDDLVAECGNDNTVYVQANNSVIATYNFRGWWN